MKNFVFIKENKFTSIGEFSPTENNMGELPSYKLTPSPSLQAKRGDFLRKFDHI
jgi:hypothetical protein